MILKNINHDLGYHTQKIVTMFFPLEKIKTEGEDENEVVTKIENGRISAAVTLGTMSDAASCEAPQNGDMAQAMSVLLFELLVKMTGFRPPWGILYGVRPARLMHAKTEQLGIDGAEEFFRSSLVHPDKIALAKAVMESENKLIRLSDESSCSLYVSIPFCPSRCSYCSFVSHSIENAADLIEPYVARLTGELKATAGVMKGLSLYPRTVYFGGGTPTTLSAAQLDRLLTAIETYFDLSRLLEYTVEAGRPDTVTREKLGVLRAHGVGRISINPQSFSDAVLQKIGRRHTVQQTLNAYALARECGFENINMDFIAGLDGDTLATFQSSIDTAVSLGAPSVTVHNLALKSAAYLVTENRYYDLGKKALASDMVACSYEKLTASGYRPYYMYRQSKSLGNLENVGWCKDGFDCLYNVYMMDETHSVFAAGAGAVTKLKNQRTGHIDRIYNFKYPYEYLRSFDEVLKRKESIYSYYREYNE